ncbi:hypothetical protein EVB55_165 [Rhizobium phage RHph_Y68]|uniref:Uncharacterized protein n=1 Tax=Rhizobium phage RHph_Y68 TaxID=2509787 RepID=A0A7S5URQ8_9CAUD|nr:hypothetical protein PP934_gp165 [Rhizobium phage RHph_Y68]QIG68100.1 hypothetical protein EVB55_165 [Rhizobium phage RHph_Y68]
MKELSEFVSRRLSQLEPIGANLIVPGYHYGNFVGKFAISTIRMANVDYTRVRNLNFDMMWHFEGVLDENDAANRGAALLEEWLKRKER